MRFKSTEEVNMERLLKAAKALDYAIDQEYDVDDGVPNFSSPICLAWVELQFAIKQVEQRQGGAGS